MSPAFRRRPCPVLLVHHQEVGVAEGAIDPPDGLGGDHPAKGRLHRHQVEGLLEHFQGAVLGPIRHHDDLKLRVVEGQEGAHRGGDGFLLVVGGHEDGNREIGLPLQKVLKGQFGKLPGVAGHHADAKEGEEGVEEVKEGEVPENEDLVGEKQGVKKVHAASLNTCWAMARP